MFVSQDRKTPNHIQTHSYTTANSVYSIHLQLDLLGLQECLLIVYLNSFFCRDQGPLMQFLSVIKHPGIANYRQMLISRYFLPKYLNSFNLITSFLRLIIWLLYYYQTVNTIILWNDSRKLFQMRTIARFSIIIKLFLNVKLWAWKRSCAWSFYYYFRITLFFWLKVMNISGKSHFRYIILFLMSFGCVKYQYFLELKWPALSCWSYFHI